MTPVDPPRLALYLLHRYGADNEALAGDLVEELTRRRSRLWFWGQVIAAIAIARFRRPAEIRPLRLVDQRSLPLQTLPSAQLRPLVNLTASPINGIGGLGIVSILLLSTAVQPAMWTLALVALIAGIVLGVARIVFTRHRAEPVHSCLGL